MKRRSFAVESTLAGRAMAKRIAKLKSDGYAVELYFVWSPHVELNLARVAERVRLGGHDVPEETIRRRYVEGLRNLFDLYMPLADRWRVLYNASRGRPKTIVLGGENITERVFMQEHWNKIAEARDHA